MQTVRAVERALEVLECFLSEKKEIGLSELSRRLNLSKATVLRLVRSLEIKGYIIQNTDNQSYRLGSKVVSLSSVFLANLDFRTIALPFMMELRNKIQETVTLYILNDNKRLCIQRVESHHSLQQVIKIGDSLPLNMGSSGKLLAAFNPLTTTDLSKNELQEILDKRYAVSFEEREKGLSSISAPIYNHMGEVIAALSVSGLAIRFTPEKIQNYIEELLDTSRKISSQLGYQEQ